MTLSTYLFPSDPWKFIHEQAQKAPRPITNLLNDLIIGIFKNLDPNDLLSCSLVCKKWSILGSKDSFWTIFLNSLFYAPKVRYIDQKTWEQHYGITRTNSNNFKMEFANPPKKNYIILNELIHLLDQKLEIMIVEIPNHYLLNYNDASKITTTCGYPIILLDQATSPLNDLQNEAIKKMNFKPANEMESSIPNSVNRDEDMVFSPYTDFKQSEQNKKDKKTMWVYKL